MSAALSDDTRSSLSWSERPAPEDMGFSKLLLPKK